MPASLRIFRIAALAILFGIGLGESASSAGEGPWGRPSFRPGYGSNGSNCRMDDRGRFERGASPATLDMLKSFYNAPAAGESNHFLDLWEPGNLANFARLQGLTNNHALFIDSHGITESSRRGARYVFRPRAGVLRPGQSGGDFSIGDIAELLGPTQAAAIHNVVVAGCNEEGSLRSASFRRYFANATNIIYMTPGHLAYKPEFYQMLTRHSEDVIPLYGRPVPSDTTGSKVRIDRTPFEGATILGEFMADLFMPGSPRPYRQQRAGRELLEPGFPRKAEQHVENSFGTIAEPASD